MGVPAKPGDSKPPGCPQHWDLAGQGAVSLTLLWPQAPCNPLGALQGHLTSMSPEPLALASPWQRWLARAAVCKGRAFQEKSGQVSHSPRSTERGWGLFRTWEPGSHVLWTPSCGWMLCALGFVPQTHQGPLPCLGWDVTAQLCPGPAEQKTGVKGGIRGRLEPLGYCGDEGGDIALGEPSLCWGPSPGRAAVQQGSR